MITPLFRLTQDDQYLYVAINAPNIRLTEAELYHDGDQFIFHAKPYYLRLNLPGQVQTSEQIETTDLDHISNNSNRTMIKLKDDTKEIVVSVPKLNVGEHFADLEMIGKFLSGPKSKTAQRLVELLDENNENNFDLIDLDEEEIDWSIEQKLPTELSDSASYLIGREPYGFANGYTGVLERLGAEVSHDVVDSCDAGFKSAAQRRQERLQQEEQHFNEDHYIADLYDSSQIDRLIQLPAPWDDWNREKSILSNEDRQRMVDQIKRRDFPKYDSTIKKALILGVVDILFAYAYDLRTNDFEHSPESAWAIKKLSPTLSWFEFWTRIDSLKNDLSLSGDDQACYVLTSCVRRTLIYPLYRHWQLALKVARDVVTILALGRPGILKCFLDLHQLFNKNGDNYYLLNDLYINDYCCWLQRQSNSDHFESLARHLSKNVLDTDRITKCCLNLDLVLIEKAAQMAFHEIGDQMDQLSQKVKLSLHIDKSTEKDLDSDDDDDN